MSLRVISGTSKKGSLQETFIIRATQGYERNKRPLSAETETANEKGGHGAAADVLCYHQLIPLFWLWVALQSSNIRRPDKEHVVFKRVGHHPSSTFHSDSKYEKLLLSTLLRSVYVGLT